MQLAPLKEVVNQVQSLSPKEGALTILIHAINLACNRGIFSIEESALLHPHIEKFKDTENQSSEP